MPNLRISLLQTALHWENKTANLDMLCKKINSIKEETEIIVLPEMFSTGFSMNKEVLAEDMDGETISWMRKTSASKGAILAGSFIARESLSGKPAYYNRLVWMLPSGDFGFYDKRHLFAYGKEDQHYSPGKKRFIASVNAWKINLQVCYDLRFPVWIRQSRTENQSLKIEYDLLIVVANWPTVRRHAWKTLLTARAIENQCYVIGVNRTGTDGKGLAYSGESMLIGPAGETIKLFGPEEDVFTHMLDRKHLEEVRSKYPFWRDADGFHIQS